MRPQPLSDHAAKLADLRAKLTQRASAVPGLDKRTSNLFRDRSDTRQNRLDLSHFNQVIEVDARAGWVDAEGMTTYADLVDATLQHDCMPSVVPELRSITLGGAATGVGIESTSFREGLVHHGLLEIDVLTPNGEICHCTPDNEHSDLFFGFPNSYGTLGYALRVRARTLPVKRYVRLSHLRYSDAESYFRDLQKYCKSNTGFIDGTVFSHDELYITVGEFTDSAPYTSDYSFRNIYYRSIRERDEDYLTTRDYIWRWDTDWFWCSKNVFAQNPLVRRLLGRKRLNSVTYTRIMRLNSRLGLTRRMNNLRGVHTESVIQDVDLPIEHAPEFLKFLLREIGILPIWICPIGTAGLSGPFPLYPLDPDRLYVNFGFWDVIRGRKPLPAGHYNRMIEIKVAEMGGIKSLYSESYYPEDEFWQIYNRDAYRALKSRYDPDNRLPDLYQKCVLRRR